jgi:RNA polymerase sigma-70 factor (ECF subfamily)
LISAVTEFHDLYERYAAAVHRLALYLSGEAAEADDLTAETFVRAWTAPGGIRERTVKAYLFTILRNLHVERSRRRARDVPLEPDAHAVAPAFEREIENRSELAWLAGALGRLPGLDRAALLMRVRDGRPYEEIAQELGLSPAAVRVRVHRARMRLAQARTLEEKPT